MKKSVKILLTTIALTVALVTPVFATESALSAESAMLEKKMAGFGSDISTLVTFDDNCGAAAIASMNQIVVNNRGDVVKSNIAEQQNYINYLNARVGNAIEIERVKLGNVNAMKDLCKVNPSFQPQLDAAIADYNKAVADHQAAVQAVADAKAYFASLNARFDAASLAKAAADAQAYAGK